MRRNALAESWPREHNDVFFEGGFHQVPRLPRKVPRHHQRRLQVPRLPIETKVDVAKCHSCHAKCRGITRDQSQPKRATRVSPVPSVPRLPRKTKVDVSKCHTCHVKRRWMSPSATPATQRWMSPSATPAT